MVIPFTGFPATCSSRSPRLSRVVSGWRGRSKPSTKMEWDGSMPSVKSMLPRADRTRARCVRNVEKTMSPPW